MRAVRFAAVLVAGVAVGCTGGSLPPVATQQPTITPEGGAPGPTGATVGTPTLGLEPTPVQPTPPTEEGIASTFPDYTGGTNGGHPEVLIGADGFVHLAYSGVSQRDGSYPVRYGECAADCASAAGWTFATIADHGLWGGFVRLALTAEGRSTADLAIECCDRRP